MTWIEQREYIEILEELIKQQQSRLKWLWSLLTPEAKQQVRDKCKEVPF